MAIDGKGAHVPPEVLRLGGRCMGRNRCARAVSKHSHGGTGGGGALLLHRWVIPYSPGAGGGMHRRQRPVWGRGRRDATDMKGQGPWRSLARAVDKHGQTMDLLLTEPRDTAAARRLLKQASRCHGLPEMLPWTVAPPRPPRSRATARHTVSYQPPPGQDCHTVVEQEHRAVQRVTRPMVGGKACAAAQDPLGGMELLPMMKQSQRVREAETRASLRPPGATPWLLHPPRQGQLPLPGPLSNICDRAPPDARR